MEIRGFKGREGPIGEAGASLVEGSSASGKGAIDEPGALQGGFGYLEFCIPRWSGIGMSIISRYQE
jgi:hypothetical protein